MTARSSSLRAVVLAGRHGADRAAQHDHLRPRVALRLEQDRVHVDVVGDAGRLGLHRLGPPDLAALRRDEGVERHVLRLERRDAQPLLAKQPAERRDEQALAHRRGRPLHHDGGGRASWRPPARATIRAECSLSR